MGQSLSQTVYFFRPWCEETRPEESSRAHPSKVMDFSLTASLPEAADVMQINILFECFKIRLPA